MTVLGQRSGEQFPEVWAGEAEASDDPNAEKRLQWKRGGRQELSDHLVLVRMMWQGHINIDLRRDNCDADHCYVVKCWRTEQAPASVEALLYNTQVVRPAEIDVELIVCFLSPNRTLKWNVLFVSFYAYEFTLYWVELWTIDHDQSIYFL